MKEYPEFGKNPGRVLVYDGNCLILVQKKKRSRRADYRLMFDPRNNPLNSARATTLNNGSKISLESLRRWEMGDSCQTHPTANFYSGLCSRSPIHQGLPENMTMTATMLMMRAGCCVDIDLLLSHSYKLIHNKRINNILIYIIHYNNSGVQGDADLNISGNG
jgi:hypothetical protein